MMKNKLKIALSCLILCTTTLSGIALFRYFSKNKPKKRNQIALLKEKKEKRLSHLWEAAGLYFANKSHEDWRDGIVPSKEEIKKQKKLFHYNLGIRHIVDNSPHIVNNEKRVTIYLHGWGDMRNSAQLLKAYCDVLPGDIITFNFRDRSVLLAPLHYSNFGQLPDVLPALYTIKWARDNLDLYAIDLFGYSRGGATAINLIAVLNDKSGLYDQDLETIGIDKNERIKLLKLIQNGTVILDCPLINMNLTVTEYFKWVDPKMAVDILQAVTKYKKDGLQAITSVDTFNDLNLKTLVHFQYNDKVVSNKKDAEFYYHLACNNPHNTYLVLGDDGGHLHTHDTLSQAIHTFRKRYGAAYDPEYSHVQLATRYHPDVETPLLQPHPYSAEYIDRIITSFYTACTAKKS